MKASVFIKTALVDQMQQIADLGLWYHLAKLLPAGADVLARVWCNSKPGVRESSDVLLIRTGVFYDDIAPDYKTVMVKLGGLSVSFYSVSPSVWFVSDQQGAEYHLKKTPTGEDVLYVPQWFDDFKSWCQLVIDGIEAGELEDIEVLKMGEE